MKARHSPFKQLEHYKPDDKDLFFGREEETEQFLRLVFRTKLVVVCGEMGVGKTSLIHCGLAKRFQPSDWAHLHVRRGAADFNLSLLEGLRAELEKWKPATLAKAASESQTVANEKLKPAQVEISTQAAESAGDDDEFSSVFKDEMKEWLMNYFQEADQNGGSLATDSASNPPAADSSTSVFAATEPEVTRLVKEIYCRALRPVYLLFDQFEEIFTYGTPLELENFTETVASLLKLREPCIVVLVLREEFLAKLISMKKRLPGILDFMVRIEPMTPNKATGVVQDMFAKLMEINKLKPHGYTFEFDPAVPRSIVNEVSEDRLFVDLTFLQIYLEKLFRLAEKRNRDQIAFTDALMIEAPEMSKVHEEFFDTKILHLVKKLDEEKLVNSFMGRQTDTAGAEFDSEEERLVFVFLKWFVTPVGTKKVVGETELPILANRFDFTSQQVNVCLEFLLQNRILRRLEKEYELVHDTVAKTIAEKRFYLPPKLERKIQVNVNPFKGLAAFSEDDSELFFGRKKPAEDILALLNRQHFAVLTGSSGTGKSSLVKAGVFPLLRSDGYRLIEIVRPGAEPVRQLTETLARMDAERLPEKGYVLLIDQFEELLTHNGQEEEIELFTKILSELIDEPQSHLSRFQSHHRVKIVVTIRSDFEPQFERRQWLKDKWQSGRYVLPPLTLEDLLEVVERPAELAAVHFRPPNLVNDIVREVYGKEAALPLLSFALSRMFEECLQNNRIIDQEIYNDVGIISSLSRHADDIYDELPTEEHRRTMKHIMLRMLSIEGHLLASRRVGQKELIFSDEAENKRVAFVLDRLIKDRLIVAGKLVVDEKNALRRKYAEQNSAIGQTPDGDEPSVFMGDAAETPSDAPAPKPQKPETTKPYYEPAHDALIWGWSNLYRWKNEFGNFNLSLRERLRLGYVAWRDHDFDEEYLWTNHPQLPALVDILYGRDNWLNKAEIDFVEKSKRLKAKAEAEIRRAERAVENEKMREREAALEAKLQMEEEKLLRQEAERRELETAQLIMIAEKEKAEAILEKERAFQREKNRANKKRNGATILGFCTLAAIAIIAWNQKNIAERQRYFAVTERIIAEKQTHRVSIIADSLSISEKSAKAAMREADSIRMIKDKLWKEADLARTDERKARLQAQRAMILANKNAEEVASNAVQLSAQRKLLAEQNLKLLKLLEESKKDSVALGALLANRDSLLDSLLNVLTIRIRLDSLTAQQRKDIDFYQHLLQKQ